MKLSRILDNINLFTKLLFVVVGYGGIIGNFLSYDLFAPLSRLTYCMYLIHIYVLFAFHMHLKEAWYLDKYLIVSEIFMACDSNQ